MFWIYAGFLGFVFLMLALDLGVFHRKAHAVSVPEALKWSAIWIALGLSFTVLVYYGYEHHIAGLGLKGDTIDAIGMTDEQRESGKLPIVTGSKAAVRYLTAYVVEKSLSVDNIFVIVMIFAFFGVPQIYQHRVLFWGILGALIMRGAMIALGAKLIHEFHWILYIFGALLIYTAYKMLFMESDEVNPNHNIVVKLTRRFFPVTHNYHGQYFVVKAGGDRAKLAATPGAKHEVDHAFDNAPPGKLFLTPLALALVIVETTDLIFAVDSIPAVFAVTADPFLVFTSNVFAILGLRSLYFALAGMMDKFRYLKVSLAIVLAFVGTKMLLAHWIKPILGENMNFVLLGVVLGILTTGVVASWMADARDDRKAKRDEALEKEKTP